MLDAIDIGSQLCQRGHYGMGRTTMRKAFLAPWHPGVAEAYVYSMALAQRETSVAVHHATLNVTHHHASATPERPNLPRFLRMLHHETSCAINTLLACERYDQPGELFDKRSTHVMRLCDAAAQATTLNYEFLNTTAAGLVARPEHMPGFVFDFELWLKGYLDVHRPDFYFSKNQPEVLRLEVTPPPLLYKAFDGDLPALVYHMKRLADAGASELRAQRKGEPLGARRLQRLHPWSEPRTLRETRGKRVPTFRIGARGIVGVERHIQAALETREYRREHRDARIDRLDGNLDREFPFGTYKMRVEHRVPVAAPPEPDSAIVTCPGPTLRQVQAELEEQRAMGIRPDRQARYDLIQEARSALTEEASDIYEHVSECMDFRTPPRQVAAPANRQPQEHETDDDDGRSAPAAEDRPVVVRHRFDKRDRTRLPARRVVTLRDRRMGRRASGAHGGDPPA